MFKARLGFKPAAQALRIGRRNYATKPPKRHTLLKFSAGAGAAATALYFSNDKVRNSANHVAQTGKRISVVTVATIKCFKIYNDVLSAEYDSPKDRSQALAEAHSKAAKITLKALEANGGIYIKLGQHVSALTYLLPREWTDTMIPLQDRCPESSMEEIEKMFKTDMGVALDSVFSEFNPKPVGVALLAQVHIATLRETGEKVAVKVQHPSLNEFVPLDVFMTHTVFSLMHKVFPEYPMVWLSDELENSIYVELDFRNEAENARKTSKYFENFRSLTALRIPEIVAAEKRILIMEYVGGARLDDTAYIARHGLNPGEVSSCLSHIFNNMIFTPGVGLHCDPHGGNLAIRALDKRKDGHNFEIILYDHGLYRYIPLQMKRDYSRLWLAILDGDVLQMRRYTERVAGITDNQKFRIFAAAITGRDPDMALNYDISSNRTSAEINNLQSLLYNQEGVLEDLMDILSSMPRIVLLILKTNDLTRSLDENLNNPLGPERTFLILANYCAKVAYDEDVEVTSQKYKRWSLSWLLHRFTCWLAYHRRTSQLYWYDLYMLVKNYTGGLRLH